jgi:hypothetical protein
MKKWREALEVQRRTKAATSMQSAARMLFGKLALRKKQNESLEHARKLQTVALMAQRWLRGKWGRRRAQDQQLKLLLHLAKQVGRYEGGLVVAAGGAVFACVRGCVVAVVVAAAAAVVVVVGVVVVWW